MSKFICTKCGYRWSETPGCKECRTFGYVVEDTEINHSKLIEALEKQWRLVQVHGYSTLDIASEFGPDLLTIVREHEEQIPEILAEKQRLNRGYKLLIEPTCALCGKTHTSAYQGQCCAVETATRLKSKDAQQKSLIKMLMEVLQEFREFLSRQPIGIFGIGSDGQYDWPIRDEIIDKITKKLSHPGLAEYVEKKDE